MNGRSHTLQPHIIKTMYNLVHSIKHVDDFSFLFLSVFILSQAHHRPWTWKRKKRIPLYGSISNILLVRKV